MLLAALLLALADGPRDPVAMARDGDTLYVANRLAGSVSVVDLPSRKVVREKVVAKRAAGIAIAGERLVVVDEALDRALLLDRTLNVVGEFAVPGGPVDVAVGPRIAIASLWGRTVTLIDADLRVRHVVALPFNPCLQLFVDGGGTLIVADAFGGRVASIDVETGMLRAVRTIEGHTIGGIAANGPRVLFAQMQIGSHMPTSRESIAGGYLVGNLVRSVRVELLARPARRVEPVGQWRLESLGRNGNAAGDPGPLAPLPGGGLVVCLGGIDAVGLRRTRFGEVARIAVGRGPSALALNDGRTAAYVANRFDDTISVIDLARGRVVDTIALGPRAPESLKRQGERLFHDARLSIHGWMSCHSCHVRGHTTGLLNDTFGDGSIHTPKRVPSLLGTAGTGPWGWNGSKATLREQVRQSLLTTMNLEETKRAEEAVDALTAYVRSLAPPPSGGPSPRGRAVFEKYECGRCHRPRAYTVGKTFDVGLADEAGQAFFNPPSLRGAGQRERFFHDGRARSLREVFTRFGHNEAGGMTGEELEELIDHLRGL